MSELLSTLKEKPTDESLQDGCNQEGHDESGVGGAWDPAVLAVGPVRRPITYTREELLRLKNSPLVRRGLEDAFAGSEPLALVLKKRSDSPNEEDRGARGDAPNENHKSVFGRERRSADPRERVRKESACETTGGGIVLSPQRRSFTSGCGAPAAAPPPPHVARTRPESPLSQQQPAKQDQGRRIGSGRIMVRDENRSGWEEPEYRSEPYRPPNTRERDRNNDRFERRSFGRDSYTSDIKRERDDRFNNEKTRDREENRRSGGRFSQRRFEKEDEPEWFSGGPTSQLETIELRGFDEPVKKNGSTNNKETEKWNNNGRPRSVERWRSEAATTPPAPANDAPAPTSQNNQEKEPAPPAPAPETKPEEPQNNYSDFNLDEFLKFDNIPEVLTNGGSETEGSRFSRWFQRESPSNDKHYERILNNVLDDDMESTTRVDPPPPPMSSVPETEPGLFAPISPAARPPISLLELLRRANAQPDHRPPEINSVGGKMHSLEELESRLRHSAPPPHPDHDLSAFKRLLAQVSGGHVVPAAAEAQRAHQPQPQPQPQPHQPMTLFQMLNKSMEAQQKVQPQPQPQPQQPHIPQDLLYKLLQVQRQQQQQGDMSGLSPVDRELLQRPEAQAILHGLKAGEITVQHLIQQLNNPGLQSRYKEVLHTILRMQHQRQMGGSPLPGTTAAPPHLVVPPHHQPLPLSPLPHTGVPTRIPSPRELAAHTQSIMQGALIKKKLEEQKENYRRRHEMQQAKQPPPMSFTPTSVLRKMTAEKETDVLPKQQQWSQPIKMPQGRPIVKGNQSGAAPQMGYTPSPADYQQHYLNHQQQMAGGMRSYPIPQQRQQVPSSLSNLNNMNNITRGVAAGTTLHQLIVQSHQRSLNEMNAGVVSAGGGGDNQLARWFSPELLARASAGKLPSVHVPNALSLEDLERHHHSPAPPVRN